MLSYFTDAAHKDFEVELVQLILQYSTVNCYNPHVIISCFKLVESRCIYLAMFCADWLDSLQTNLFLEKWKASHVYCYPGEYLKFNGEFD